MASFINREDELKELAQLSGDPSAQLVLIHGRRRVGKTRLLLQWAKTSGLPYIYWVARRESPEATRASLASALREWQRPARASSEVPTYGSWSLLFEDMAQLVGTKRVLLILDEFPYAVESDPSLPSHLQASWDHQLKNTSILLVLAGSHIGMMVDLLRYDAPLYGRSTAQLSVEPLPFSALSAFFPGYSADERVAAYAVVGGIPAYLERFHPGASLSANIRRHLFQRSGMFRGEPALLISDLVRETRNYEAILRAVASGNHTSTEIARAAHLSISHLPIYMKQLIGLGFMERRIPATVPPRARRSAKRGRYYLRDPYLRFYFRFIDPHLEMIEQGLTELLWSRIREQFRAYVGATAFEELCREWLLGQARQGQLPFQPELVGSHWSKQAQVDVVAINWRERAILLGECKWGARPVGETVIRELIEKAPKVVPAEGWQVHYAFFARAGFSQAARRQAEAIGAHLVDLKRMDQDWAAQL